MRTLFRWAGLLMALPMVLLSCSPEAATGVASPTALATITPTRLPGVPPPIVWEYVDPSGWYAVHFFKEMYLWEYQAPIPAPERWTSNRFHKDYRFLETGYLPYMSRFEDLCVWLANVKLKREESAIHWAHPCFVTTDSLTIRPVKYTIYENRAADLDHRFFYIGASQAADWSERMDYSLVWLKGAGATGPTATPGPISTEAAAFWEQSAGWRQAASFEAYPLPAEAQSGTTDKTLMQFVPKELRPEGVLAGADPQGPAQEAKLKALGYTLVETRAGDRHMVDRNGRLLFEDVVEVSPVYEFSAGGGPITAFVVNTRPDGSQEVQSFLVLNEVVSLWDYSARDPGLAPILYQGELLWLKAGKGSRAEVRSSRRDVIFTFNTYAGARPVEAFEAWDGHWILNSGNFLVQDGEILNEALGYQEIFGWSVFDDKPAYFFRKGSMLGLSYDGKHWFLDYQEILHGQCCGLEANNPVRIGNSLHFFALRDGSWMYVVAKLE